jgi:hypothetical protein
MGPAMTPSEWVDILIGVIVLIWGVMLIWVARA